MPEPIRVSHENMPIWCWDGNRVCSLELLTDYDGVNGTRWYRSPCNFCNESYRTFEEALTRFAEVSRFAGSSHCYINGDENTTPIDQAIRLLANQKQKFIEGRRPA